MLITLLYSRPIGDAWRAAAEAARERLRAALLPALAFADAPVPGSRRGRTSGRDAATTRN